MGNLQFEAIFAYLENVSSTKWGTSLAHPDKPHCAAQKKWFCRTPRGPHFVEEIVGGIKKVIYQPLAEAVLDDA